MVATIGCTSCSALATAFVLFKENEDIDARCGQCADELTRSDRDIIVTQIDKKAVEEAAYESFYG